MTWRLYYNRRGTLPWSVDNGSQTTEVNVSSFELHKCNAVSRFDPSIAPNPDTPCAWIEVTHARMELRDGVAWFFFDQAWRQPPISPQTPEQREARNEREINERMSEIP